MTYTLAVLTHGSAPDLAPCLESFKQFVHPQPATTLLVVDGPSEEGLRHATDEGHWFDEITYLEPTGFCGATEELWDLASRSANEFVFWLEGDFLFNRIVDIEEIAIVLNERPDIIQMSLLRNAVNAKEVAAGGLVRAYPEWFTHEAGYMTQRTYWTTNPSLFRRETSAIWKWPLSPECEGLFAHHLKQAIPEVKFGVWGNGEIWVTHIGQRSGFGY